VVPVTIGPQDQAGADRSRLRAAHADREQAIEALKNAFADGRLTIDELDAWTGRALTARTYLGRNREPMPWTAAMTRSPPTPVPTDPTRTDPTRTDLRVGKSRQNRRRIPARARYDAGITASPCA
jgi:hypothetical protein